ncbi:hypothetical protein, conserved [Eimeria brunetti]|uniref:Uncharacterized protein n=1 Tax=Eimeria brunetti TaxID=51314 RepID=U6LKJ8_9EIME|nr:hypothetical protein, conserved [Eimeria brunetti]
MQQQLWHAAAAAPAAAAAAAAPAAAAPAAPAAAAPEPPYIWAPPSSTAAPAAAATALMGAPLGAPMGSNPMRELRILLHDPQEQEETSETEEETKVVAVKLLSSNPSDRGGPRGLRSGGSAAAAAAAAAAGGSAAGLGSSGSASGAAAGAGGATAAGAAAGAAAAAAAGTAEIFGLELLPEVEVVLPAAARTAIFTWGGCSLQEYEASDRPMSFLLNFSSVLHARRQAAAAAQTIGPRVLVTGSNGSGKSSVCQILCNYAMRAGWTPLFVELDARGSCDKGPLQMPPGCIGSCVCRSLDAEAPENPLLYFIGSSSSNQPGDSSSSSSSSNGGLAAAAARLAPAPPDVELPEPDTAAAAAAAAEGAAAAGEGATATATAAAAAAATAAAAAGDSCSNPGEITAELFPWVCCCLSKALYAAFAQSLLQQQAAEDKDEHIHLNETHPPSLAASGMIANAPQQVSLQQLQQLIDLFGFDVVVVLDNPSLSHELAGVYGHLMPDTAEEAAAQQQMQQQQQQQQLLLLQQQQRQFLTPAAAAAAAAAATRVEVVSLPKLEGTVAPDAARVPRRRPCASAAASVAAPIFFRVFFEYSPSDFEIAPF